MNIPYNGQQFPIPAVRALIVDEFGKLLILKRDNTDFGKGDWCLPGGKVDYGRTVEEALAAELREELAVSLLSCDFFFFQDSLPLVADGPHFINFYFHCRIENRIRLNEESSDLAWIGPDDLENYTVVFRNDEAIIRHFNKKNITGP